MHLPYGPKYPAASSYLHSLTYGAHMQLLLQPPAILHHAATGLDLAADAKAAAVAEGHLGG